MPPHSTPAHRPQGQYLKIPYFAIYTSKIYYIACACPAEYHLTAFSFIFSDLTVVKTVHCSTDDEEDIMIDDETTPSNHSGE